jgi:polar amino acid transport system substrate-binding protein
MYASAKHFPYGSAQNPARKPGLFFWLSKILSHQLTFTTIIELLDALGLSTLSIIGVIVALETKSTPLWLWGPIFAAITSAGGGILRDMVRADPNNSSLKGSFYPLIAVIWGLIFSLFIIWYSNRLNYYPDEIFLAVMGVIAGSFLTRIVAILLRIKTPSYFYAKTEEAIET